MMSTYAKSEIWPCGWHLKWLWQWSDWWAFVKQPKMQRFTGDCNNEGSAAGKTLIIHRLQHGSYAKPTLIANTFFKVLKLTNNFFVLMYCFILFNGNFVSDISPEIIDTLKTNFLWNHQMNVESINSYSGLSLQTLACWQIWAQIEISSATLEETSVRLLWSFS